MTTGTLLWLLVYAVATVLFFGVACVITVIGIRDLKDLLSRSGKNK
jgi:hypothetical protein